MLISHQTGATPSSIKAWRRNHSRWLSRPSRISTPPCATWNRPSALGSRINQQTLCLSQPRCDECTRRPEALDSREPESLGLREPLFYKTLVKTHHDCNFFVEARHRRVGKAPLTYRPGRTGDPREQPRRTLMRSPRSRSISTLSPFTCNSKRPFITRNDHGGDPVNRRPKHDGLNTYPLAKNNLLHDDSARTKICPQPSKVGIHTLNRAQSQRPKRRSRLK